VAERAEEALEPADNDPLSLEMSMGSIWGVFKGRAGKGAARG